MNNKELVQKAIEAGFGAQKCTRIAARDGKAKDDATKGKTLIPTWDEATEIMINQNDQVYNKEQFAKLGKGNL